MDFEIAIIGAGASGLMCAMTALRNHQKVVIFESNERVGRKLAATGGGKCNFTNETVHPQNDFLSQNPYFALSALRRYQIQSFFEWMEKHHLEWEIRERGCYFGLDSARLFGEAFQHEIEASGGVFKFQTPVSNIQVASDGHFILSTNKGVFHCQKVVIAVGGMAAPALGGTDWGLRIAQQFGLSVISPKPGLSPLLWDAENRAIFGDLKGIALPKVKLKVGSKTFEESLVFRPDGLGGIGVYQASLEWAAKGGTVEIDWMPGESVQAWIQQGRQENGIQQVATRLSWKLPKRLVKVLLQKVSWSEQKLSLLKKTEIDELIQLIHHWSFIPKGTGGYADSEVMLGGVNCDELSSKTFEVKKIPGLYFIGEVLDVTGQLGGYNLHWAWASGYCAGSSL